MNPFAVAPLAKDKPPSAPTHRPVQIGAGAALSNLGSISSDRRGHLAM
jgi:hypothetical protein